MPNFQSARPVAAVAPRSTHDLSTTDAGPPVPALPPQPERPPQPLRDFGLFGLDHLEPAVVAALADAQPLLLIGQPGCAKSELLNRVASALGLRHRHYNASMVSFDDLLGFPVPTADRTSLVHLHTKDDIWDAESVFIDEISRCRPELQNKFFSIVHERKVNGQPLGSLVYRWSAMNPPPGPDDDPAELCCAGSVPLDFALADRFAWVLELPAFDELDHATRGLILAHGDAPKNDGRLLRFLIEETRLHVAALGDDVRANVHTWVNALTAPMRAAGWPISGRRAVMLVRCAVAMVAAHRALQITASLEECLWATLRFCVPHAAAGKVVEPARLRAIHRAAWRDVQLPPTPAALRIREAPDPVARVAIALQLTDDTLTKAQLSELVTDALASRSLPHRYVLARNIAAALKGDRLTAAAYEVLFDPLGKLREFMGEASHRIEAPRQKARHLDAVNACCARLTRRGQPRDFEMANILNTLIVVERVEFDPEELVALDARWHGLFSGRQEVA